VSIPFKFARGFLYLSALYVALVTPSTLFPFIVGKYAWFRGMVDLALIAFAIGLLFYDGNGAMWTRLKETFRKPLAITVSAFVTLFVLAGFFGVDPAMSFWSNFERGEGSLQLLHLFAFFVLLVTLFRDEKDWRRFFGWLIAGGLLSMAYGFLAASGTSGFLGSQFSEGAGFRFQASIGNSAYVAAFAIFIACYAGYLLWSRYRHRLMAGGAWILYGTLVLMAASFLLAATRGAFLGLLAGLVVGAGYYVFAHRAWRRWFAVGATVLVLTVGTLVFFRDSAFVKAIPGSRIFDISVTAETFQHRTIMWGMALEGWKERPILGWGPENYIQIFDQKMDPAYFKPGEGFGAWFDRAHSVYFDYLAETGALGLFAFLAILAALFWTLFHQHKSAQSVPIRGGSNGLPLAVPKALIMGTITAYLVQGLVLFDVLPIYYNVFSVLAFSTFLFRKEKDVLSSQHRSSWAPATVAVPLALLALAGLVFGSYAPVVKARAYISALQTVSEVNSVDGFKAHFNPALTHWSPIGQEEVVKYLGSDISNLVARGDQPEEVARTLVAYIEPHLFSNNVRHLLMGGHFSYALWENYGRKPEDYVRAEEYYTAAYRIGPTLPPALYSLFDLAMKGGQLEKVRAVGNEILRLWPDAEDVKAVLATP